MFSVLSFQTMMHLEATALFIQPESVPSSIFLRTWTIMDLFVLLGQLVLLRGGVLVRQVVPLLVQAL